MAPRGSYQKLGLEKIAMSATDFADIRDQHKIFARSALQQLDGFNYTGGSSPERLQGALVTSPWFDVLGSKPLLGRGFLPEEDQPGANHVVVLSYKLWQQFFGGDRAIIGRSLEFNQTPYRVVGVMPADFRWPAEADLWAPLGLPPQAYGPDNRFNENYFAVARLAPGVSYARAAGFVQGLSQRVLEQVPYVRGSQWSMVLEPFTEYTAGNLKTPLFLLFGAVALVLLIACSNVAGLMLVRATARAGVGHSHRPRGQPDRSDQPSVRRDLDFVPVGDCSRLRLGLWTSGCAFGSHAHASLLASFHSRGQPCAAVYGVRRGAVRPCLRACSRLAHRTLRAES